VVQAGEQPENPEAETERPRPGRKTNGEARQTGTQQPDSQDTLAPESVRQHARRQCRQAVTKEGGARQDSEPGVTEVKFLLNQEQYGGKDQHHEMVCGVGKSHQPDQSLDGGLT
jgi:hypothetical protein